ncbi:3-mercaptopyruvate sulfurtransferase [Aerophototrophica crusticola]|uniref:Sulfurtransferase n=1 Tax=Aerophototrophica crusticola TaxID=1709002 RepID=A0A858R688_9PROT|nr:3-mercaptopyruvate sulfurtransferase [Rhodospirillaceae bacterium B3]
MATARDPLVTVEWLASRLGDPSVRVLDASWHLPTLKRDPRAEFLAGHIPGARFFDIDALSAPGTDLPHMLPSPAAFGEALGALGIGSGDTVVVYDSVGISSAPRAWWMFRAFGHLDVFVLDGGLPAWTAAGHPVETGEPSPAEPRSFRARLDPALVRDVADIRANLETGSEQVVDARAAGRFEGTAPEPRPGLRMGHIPGSLNLPFTDLLDPATKTLLPADTLRDRFKAAGVDLSRPVTTSCGSGITACVLALALYRIGRSDVPVYDGSWAEWGAREDLPLATGPAHG